MRTLQFRRGSTHLRNPRWHQGFRKPIVGAVGKVIVVVIAAVAILLAITVLAYVGPFVAVIGVILAAVVIANPGGVGVRLRQSLAWWSIPGMRRASSRAVPFAAMLALYTVPVPIAAFALVHNSTHGSPSSPSGPALAVGGGPTSAAATPTAIVTPGPTVPSTAAATIAATVVATVAPTARPTTPPTRAPTAAPTPRPTPTPPPPPNLCGAPPNPWNYNFCGGGTISNPPSNFCTYFTCIKTFWQSTNGYVEECTDGEYSHSGGVRGSCSKNGGNLRALNP